MYGKKNEEKNATESREYKLAWNWYGNVGRKEVT